MSKMFDSEINVKFSVWWTPTDVLNEDNEGWFTVEYCDKSFTPNGAVWVDTRDELKGFIKGAASAIGIGDDEFDISLADVVYHGWAAFPVECTVEDVDVWCDYLENADAPITADDAFAMDAVRDAKFKGDKDATKQALSDYYELLAFEDED